MSEKEQITFCCDEQRILELAMEMGQILLQSGAEVFRAEDTMRRVCTHFQVDTCNFFVTANSIMSSVTTLDCPLATVRYVPVRGTRFDCIIAVNQLSREIIEGKYETIDEIERRVMEIKSMPPVSNRLLCFGSAMAAASFCVLFGGAAADAATAFFAGFVLYLFLLHPGKHMSRIFANICSGAIITLFCLLSYRFDLGQNLNHMISGAILPLVPGVAFTNGIRDIGGGDHLSGTIRLLEAFWTFLCIAIGVGVVFGFYQRITGGPIL